jgi:hypothetical protein
LFEQFSSVDFMQRIRHSLCNDTTNLLIVYVLSCVIYMLVIPSLTWNPSFYVAIMGIFGYANNVVTTQTFDHEQLVDSACMFVWDQKPCYGNNMPSSTNATPCIQDLRLSKVIEMIVVIFQINTSMAMLLQCWIFKCVSPFFDYGFCFLDFWYLIFWLKCTPRVVGILVYMIYTHCSELMKLKVNG